MRNSVLLVTALSVVLPAAGLAEPKVPTSGVLMAMRTGGVELGQCPLEHTDVRIEISGDVARARVTQTFANPYKERIEAVYAFPLPEKAAVNGYEMRVGDRLIRGTLKRKDDAREEYERARNRGEAAALMEQERPNLFTQSVANIPPGGKIQVTLEYVDALPYADGAYQLAFPMTIGPRYIPGPAAQGSAPADADKVTPPVILEGDAGHRIDVAVDIDAGVPLLGVASGSHAVIVDKKGPARARVVLDKRDRLPNRDFLLTLQVAPEKVASGAVVHRAPGKDGFIKLFLIPAQAPRVDEITPKELIFVLDTSGSMYGTPMEVSRKAMKRALEHLHPRDTFALLRYSDTASALSATPMANTPENVAKAVRFLDSLQGEGGTDALGGVRAAFAYPHEEGKLRIVVFLTDGFIGNESQITTEIRRRIGAARLFSVGIGSSVNRYLIRGMADAGRGAEIVVTPRDKADEVVDRLFHRVSSPYLTDVEIDWNGLAVTQVAPSPVPDLFAGQPLALYARYQKGGRAAVKVRGRLAGKPFEQSLDVTLPDAEPANQAVATLWARNEIERLSAEGELRGEAEVKDDIVRLALEHSLMSRYTSFVAVEQREVADASGPPRRVEVPVALPEGVSAERIFGAELSLERFQPGDPEIRIFAPAGAKQVTVVFPFGETKSATWDPRVEAWTTRFLVPRGTPEGIYHIHVLVTLDDGARQRFQVAYAVDSGAPQFDLALRSPLIPGQEVVLEAVQRATESDAVLHGRPRERLRAQVIADVTRLAARMPDGSVVELAEVTPGRWRGRWLAPADATDRLAVVLTAVDMAGNKGVQQIVLSR